MLWNDWTRRGLDPWAGYVSDFGRLSDEMNKLFSWTTTPYVGSEFPRVNVWLGEDKATVLAEVAGMDPKDIDLTVSGETLTLKGSRNPYEAKKDDIFHRQERGFGSFSRTITLPFRTDAEAVDAKFDNGLLWITIPRAEADKPKKIQVKGA